MRRRRLLRPRGPHPGVAGHGRRRRLTRPSVWSTDFRAAFRDLAGQPVFRMLVAADNV
ncbi:hypothetical protein [Streptomyces sp. NPDC056399]|uniref:hypothetical protein n=1 Tax=Streptomyces sp. NPDC056399 TaxID=3345807 RepID=UPI0035E0CB63